MGPRTLPSTIRRLTYGTQRAPGEDPQPAAKPAEDRDQLLARRRAARREWHTARTAMERTAPQAGAQPVRARAQRAEKEARAAYQRVAQETGLLLGRLQNAARRDGGSRS